ncbi:MAG TPA: HNH endonuclease [Flavipsychrobacter sp.]
MPRDLWTREQTIIAFNLYCCIPFGHAHSRNENVIRVANLIGRSPSAVARKLGNFASLDPELKKRNIKGLGNRSKLDEEIWNEFHSDWNNAVFESTSLIAKYDQKQIDDLADLDIESLPTGVDKLRLVKTRVYQSFFRKAVFADYNNACCITGIKNINLLVASHIKPWSKDELNRTNPKNGLCLNALHDKAFDRGLITILPTFKICISKYLDGEDDNVIDTYFKRYENAEIAKPEKFTPDKSFLDYHYEYVFMK